MTGYEKAVVVCAGPVVHTLRPGGYVGALRTIMSEYEPDYVNRDSIATKDGKPIKDDYVTREGDTIVFHFARVDAEKEVS